MNVDIQKVMQEVGRMHLQIMMLTERIAELETTLRADDAKKSPPTDT